MGRKIGIIGMGNVGSTLAYGLICQGICDDYVLIDQNAKKVEADWGDFLDAAANLDNHANIYINDYSSLSDADIVISALGNIKLQDNPNADRFAELNYTAREVKKVSQKLKEINFNGIILAITNPVDVITNLYQHYTNLPKEKVIGTGTLLDTARMKRVVGKQFKVNPKSISGYNLGEHGNSQFTAWSQVKVKGNNITELLDHSQLQLLEKEAIFGGHTVFFGKKYTNFGIASAAIKLIKTILSDSNEELPVSQYISKFDTYLSYPAIVGRQGIVDQIELTLSKEEENKLQESAEYIKQKFKENQSW